MALSSAVTSPPRVTRTRRSCLIGPSVDWPVRFENGCAALETIPGAENYIRKRIVEDRATHKVVSEELKLLYPWLSRGLSRRSIRRFCEVHDFHATSRLADTQLDMVVRTSIHKVSL